MAKKKVNVMLEESVIEKLDDYAQNMDISRSAAIAVLVNQAIEYSNAISALPKMLETLEKAK